MHQPDGKLTAVQYQIMQVVWDRDVEGVTAAEIWEFVAQERGVGRTTVLKQIQRLESRKWLRRKPEGGVARYVATVGQDLTAQTLADEFVDDFFDGSLSDLVMSLLGTRKIKAEEVNRLRKILDQHREKRGAGNTRKGRRR